MLTSIKYELNPSKTQAKGLNQTFGNCRFVYNWALDKKIKAYSESKKTLSCFDLSKELTHVKKELEWLKLSGAQALQQSISNLDSAFTNFFRTKEGFPKFKNKNSKQSFRVSQDVKIKYNNYKFCIPKVGWVKFYKDKEIDGVIRFATVSKSTTGRYFVSITYDTTKERKTGNGVVGIDLGIKNLAITSDGEVFENQKHLKSNLTKLRIEQRKLQRKFKKGKEQSKNWHKQKLVVAKIHEKIAFQRKDQLHKITSYIATTYETVCIEDLATSNMLKNSKLSLAISEMGWGMFREMLNYKVKDLRVIGRFEPSSKTCNLCGDINKELKLSNRVWTCKNGHKLDRDLNAALNIKNWGLRASTFDAKTAH